MAGIDFQVRAGEFVGYAGPNGAGKSTTVKMMSGILLPSSGRLEVLGLVPYRERKRLARRMGVVFGQRTQLWWDLPLRESFDLVGHLYRIPPADRVARLGRQGPPGLPGWLAWLTAPVAAAFLALGGLAWRAGIRHYVGTGS